MILQETDDRQYIFTYNKNYAGAPVCIAMLLHIDENDDFGILLATAQDDTIGAVTIKPIE